MSESTPLLLFALGLFVGLATPVLATKILGRIGSRTEVPYAGPKDVAVVLSGDHLDRIAETISVAILHSVESHIRDLKKPSSN